MVFLPLKTNAYCRSNSLQSISARLDKEIADYYQLKSKIRSFRKYPNNQYIVIENIDNLTKNPKLGVLLRWSKDQKKALVLLKTQQIVQIKRNQISYRAKPSIIANAKLSPTRRISKIEKFLKRKLSPQQKELILTSHTYKGIHNHQVFEFNTSELLKKVRVATQKVLDLKKGQQKQISVREAILLARAGLLGNLLGNLLKKKRTLPQKSIGSLKKRKDFTKEISSLKKRRKKLIEENANPVEIVRINKVLKPLEEEVDKISTQNLLQKSLKSSLEKQEPLHRVNLEDEVTFYFKGKLHEGKYGGIDSANIKNMIVFYNGKSNGVPQKVSISGKNIAKKDSEQAKYWIEQEKRVKDQVKEKAELEKIDKDKESSGFEKILKKNRRRDNITDSIKVLSNYFIGNPNIYVRENIYMDGKFIKAKITSATPQGKFWAEYILPDGTELRKLVAPDEIKISDLKEFPEDYKFIQSWNDKVEEFPDTFVPSVDISMRTREVNVIVKRPYATELEQLKRKLKKLRRDKSRVAKYSAEENEVLAEIIKLQKSGDAFQSYEVDHFDVLDLPTIDPKSTKLLSDGEIEWLRQTNRLVNSKVRPLPTDNKRIKAFRNYKKQKLNSYKNKLYRASSKIQELNAYSSSPLRGDLRKAFSSLDISMPSTSSIDDMVEFAESKFYMSTEVFEDFKYYVLMETFTQIISSPKILEKAKEFKSLNYFLERIPYYSDYSTLKKEIKFYDELLGK